MVVVVVVVVAGAFFLFVFCFFELCMDTLSPAESASARSMALIVSFTIASSHMAYESCSTPAAV